MMLFMYGFKFSIFSQVAHGMQFQVDSCLTQILRLFFIDRLGFERFYQHSPWGCVQNYYGNRGRCHRTLRFVVNCYSLLVSLQTGAYL
jgi:hypothetical protein